MRNFRFAFAALAATSPLCAAAPMPATAPAAHTTVCATTYARGEHAVGVENNSMKPERTKEGLVVLYHAEKGTRIERWPVDARGMIACGEYVEYPEQVGKRGSATTIETRTIDVNPSNSIDTARGVAGEGSGEGATPEARQGAVSSDSSQLPPTVVVKPGEGTAPYVPGGTLDPAETVRVHSIGTPAPSSDTPTPPWAGVTPLPQTNALGAPAVYSSAADAKPAASTEPKRTTRANT